MAKLPLPKPIEEVRLTKEDQETIEGLGVNIEALEREVVKAERAGIEVAAVRTDLDKMKKLRLGILTEYGT